MNDPHLVIDKLKQLANEAMTASSEIEKAAIFGAVSTFAHNLNAANQDNLAENIERARWSICAILGYDVTNGHSREQHLSWALAALIELERGFSRI